MLKVVLKVGLHNEKAREKAIDMVSGFAGVDSLIMDMKDRKLTVTGAIDAVDLVTKLRKKFGFAEIVAMSDQSKRKKNNNKKDNQEKIVRFCETITVINESAVK